MNTDQPKSAVAQPAGEALKKHGDQLQKQVDEAAGKQLQDNKGDGKDEQDQDA